ncbi:hypothetical protein RF11_07341 [Thelohanellus kitauei]|uniref:Uncharacterized protein n=1 Tax=Thelohanellus kitauei TaxID=669202 RepID=A0A0C2N775_THEKT|nr:hypothetical protein RF11_07341 [Thelohanellus kitauei]
MRVLIYQHNRRNCLYDSNERYKNYRRRISKFGVKHRQTWCILEARCEFGYLLRNLNDRQESLVATKLKEKLQQLNVKSDFCNFPYVVYQYSLCSQTTKVVVKTVNVIRAKGLNHIQFNSLLDKLGALTACHIIRKSDDILMVLLYAVFVN